MNHLLYSHDIRMIMTNRCFINSIAQVSCQKPLSDEWLESPRRYDEDYVRAIEPDIKGLITPGEARRMSKILKRAVATALNALSSSDVSQPDAIITGTGMGCMDNSERFLVDLSRFGESCLKPTLFMQSTHNTISSLVAIALGCHGYNNTYSHKALSAESALLDAWCQMRCGMIGNALVSAHDEVTPFMRRVMKYSHPEYKTVSEVSASVILTNSESPNNYCEITDIKLFYRPEIEDIAANLSKTDDGVLLLGVNGNELNDVPYRKLIEALQYTPYTIQYKNIFGDNFSASALALIVGATILKRQSIPEFLSWDNPADYNRDLNAVTILNQSDSTAWSLIRLRKV